MFYVRVLMEWTTEKPTQDGFYWVWNGHERNMAEVIKDGTQFQVWIEDGWCRPDKFTHFIGPLPEPEPPQMNRETLEA